MRALLRHSCDVAKWAPVVARSRPVPDYGARVGTVDIVSEDLVFLAQTFGSGDVASGELRRASVVVRRLLNDAQLVQALKATGATEPLRLEAYPIEQALPHGGATSGILLAMAGGPATADASLVQPSCRTGRALNRRRTSRASAVPPGLLPVVHLSRRTRPRDLPTPDDQVHGE